MIFADVTQSAMTTFLSSMTEIATWFFSQAAKVGETVVSTPLLLVGVSLSIIGGAIGLFFRFVHH